MLDSASKNIRMNKAILSKLLELPLSENDSKDIYTLGMDWLMWLHVCCKENQQYLYSQAHQQSVHTRISTPIVFVRIHTQKFVYMEKSSFIIDEHYMHQKTHQKIG
ncbi:hypothetical protein RMATCC62417_12532 [Rhizopus microsporus]|nr:hypothetical protein RMATCC62417_12532 [Rhizopus microsporus]